MWSEFAANLPDSYADKYSDSHVCFSIRTNLQFEMAPTLLEMLAGMAA